jgi:hypothetical protein
MFDCKTYVFLKDSDVLSRLNKKKARVFVIYLVKYDFINICRIWNFEKNDVNDYKDVIFDKTVYFNTYNKKDLIKKSERKNFVQFRIYSI